MFSIRIAAIVIAGGLAITVSCASNQDSCQNNDTKVCACAGGTSGVQTCTDGEYGTCQCGSGPGSGDAGSSIKHVDVCVAPAFDCGGPATGLDCVTDHPGDSQGICRRVCTSFSVCLNDDQARSRFDTDCCPINGGSRVCDMSSMFPSGSCN